MRDQFLLLIVEIILIIFGYITLVNKLLKAVCYMIKCRSTGTGIKTDEHDLVCALFECNIIAGRIISEDHILVFKFVKFPLCRIPIQWIPDTTIILTIK